MEKKQPIDKSRLLNRREQADVPGVHAMEWPEFDLISGRDFSHQDARAKTESSGMGSLAEDLVDIE